MYSIAVSCCSGVPRKSRSGPTQAQAVPQTSPCLSKSRFTCAGSMWEGSSIGISMLSNPQRLNLGNSFVLSLVKGEVKRKVLMPNLIVKPRVRTVLKVSKDFSRQTSRKERRGCKGTGTKNRDRNYQASGSH